MMNGAPGLFLFFSLWLLVRGYILMPGSPVKLGTQTRNRVGVKRQFFAIFPPIFLTQKYLHTKVIGTQYFMLRSFLLCVHSCGKPAGGEILLFYSFVRCFYFGTIVLAWSKPPTQTTKHI